MVVHGQHEHRKTAERLQQQHVAADLVGARAPDPLVGEDDRLVLQRDLGRRAFGAVARYLVAGGGGIGAVPVGAHALARLAPREGLGLRRRSLVGADGHPRADGDQLDAHPLALRLGHGAGLRPPADLHQPAALARAPVRRRIRQFRDMQPDAHHGALLANSRVSSS